MRNKNIALMILSLIILIVGIFLSLSSFSRNKKTELDFNDKKAKLVKENLDMKDNVDFLREEFAKYSSLEKEKLILEADLKLLKDETEKLKRVYKELKLSNYSLISSRNNLFRQVSVLKEKNIVLSEKTTQLKSTSSLQQAQENKFVSLSPILVKSKEKKEESISVLSEARKKGNVVSLDAKDNLLIIDLGFKDEIKRGDRCLVLKDENEIASGEIISVRYKVAAVFIDYLKFGNKINDIKEGSSILVKESN